jgi:N-acetylneuraminic acid mutarotase
MKRIAVLAAVMLSAAQMTAQVEVDRKVQLTGSGSDAKIEGVQEVTQDFDAANKKYVDDAIGTIDGSETKINAGTNITVTGTGTSVDPYVIGSAGSSGEQCIFLPARTSPSGYYFTGYRQTLTGDNPAGFWYSTKANYPKPRKYTRAVGYNDNMYVFGGQITNGSSSDGYFAYRFNTASNTWTPLASMPDGSSNNDRYRPEVVNGIIYLIGGIVDDNTCGTNYGTIAYNPGTNTYSSMAVYPGNGRFGHATAVYNDRIYSFGGVCACNSGGCYRAESYEFNPATNTWVQRANLPVGRYGHVAEAVGNKIYIIGGSISGNEYSNTVMEYDPVANTYVTKASMPTGRTEMGSAVYNGKIYVFGGSSNSSSQLNIVEVYDPATNTWSAAENMPVAKPNVGVAEANGKLYLVGGSYGTTVYNQTWEYSPAQDVGPVIYMHCKQ